MPRSGIAGSYGNSILVFWGTAILFSIVAAPIYIPTNSVGGSPLLHTLSSICYLSSTNTLISDFWPPEPWGNKFLLFKVTKFVGNLLW